MGRKLEELVVMDNQSANNIESDIESVDSYVAIEASANDVESEENDEQGFGDNEADQSSDDDSDAPEAISTSKAKEQRLTQKKNEMKVVKQTNADLKRKRRKNDAILKEQKQAKQQRTTDMNILPLEVLDAAIEAEKQSQKFDYQNLGPSEPRKIAPNKKVFGDIEVRTRRNIGKERFKVDESAEKMKTAHFYSDRIFRVRSCYNVTGKGQMLPTRFKKQK